MVLINKVGLPFLAGFRSLRGSKPGLNRGHVEGSSRGNVTTIEEGFFFFFNDDDDDDIV